MKSILRSLQKQPPARIIALGFALAILLGAGILCLLVLFLACSLYIWPLLAVFDFPLKKLLKQWRNR